MQKIKVIGHRGARGLAPENTLASFKKALDYKVDVIEFDVRVTMDNVAIIHHNSSLKDPSGNRFPIARSSYERLKEHKPDLVTFEETMDYLRGKVPVFIEVKARVQLEPVVKLVERQLTKGWDRRDITIGSKSQKTLVGLHRALPDIKNRVIERWSGIKAVHKAKLVDTNIIGMNHRFLWFGFISAMSKRGYELYPYPLNDVKKTKRWAKRGMAGVITDFPDRMQDL